MENEMQGGATADRSVEMGDAVRLAVKNYANFNGRTSRGGYWWYILAVVLASIAISVVDSLFFGSGFGRHGNGPLAILFSLATIIPGLSITVRRFHDLGRSGWWYLIVFTIIGAFVILYWFCQPGTRGDNKYGADVEAGR